MMEEYIVGEEEVHLEPQAETTQVAEPEEQKEAQNPAQKERKKKSVEKSRTEQGKEAEENNDFISNEAYSFWKENLSNKVLLEKGGSVLSSHRLQRSSKREAGTCYASISHLVMLQWSGSLYSNVINMKEDTVYVKGVWVPMGHERINEVLQIRDPKNGSKYKKLIREPNHEKIVCFLIGGKGKWNSTKKNPHESIPRGSLIEEAKVWFYFIAFVIIPTKHLCTIRENEAIILYALLKGYKFDVGKIIETSIKTFHKFVKKGLIPHLAIITRLCILAGVKGIWVEEETCPRTSPLTLTGVIKGPKSRKMKEMEIVEVEEEPMEEEEE